MATLNPLWRFRTSGAPPTDPRRPYVVVSNHESFADILLISHLPWEMKWLSKAELFRIPVMGWLMRMAGDIPVRRGETASARGGAARCRTAAQAPGLGDDLSRGHPSPTDEHASLQGRRFPARHRAGVPILPLAVSRHRHRLPKRLAFGRSVAEVRVLEPIETGGSPWRTCPLCVSGSARAFSRRGTLSGPARLKRRPPGSILGGQSRGRLDSPHHAAQREQRQQVGKHQEKLVGHREPSA